IDSTQCDLKYHSISDWVKRWAFSFLEQFIQVIRREEFYPSDSKFSPYTVSEILKIKPGILLVFSTTRTIYLLIYLYGMAATSITWSGPGGNTHSSSAIVIHFAKIQFQHRHRGDVGSRYFALESIHFCSLNEVNSLNSS